MNNVDTKLISVRLSQEINSLLNAIVEENKITKNDFIRQAVVEKIEDIYDSKIADEADEAYKKWVEGGKKTFTHKEMMKRYG